MGQCAVENRRILMSDVPADFVTISETGGAGHTQVPIIRAIVALADELGLAVIAEGVETPRDVERLKQLNCRLGQGFAFGAAMTAPEFAKQLAAQLAR